VLQKTRFLLRSNSLPPPGKQFEILRFQFSDVSFFAIFGSRLFTLFRTNGNATVDILIAVIHFFSRLV
jgi:hypothetical protein